MQSGEYFLKESERQIKRLAERRLKQEDAKKKQMERRQAAFIPPKEPRLDNKVKTPYVLIKYNFSQCVDSLSAVLSGHST